MKDRANWVGTRQAHADAAAALERARTIPDAALRAEALAHLAWHAHETGWRALAGEAVAATAEVSDPYPATRTAAWPLRLCLERGEVELARRVMDTAFLALARIVNPVARADAAEWLWQAAVPYPGEIRDQVLAELITACTRASGWKAGVYLRDATLALAVSDPAAARALLAQIPGDKFRRQAEHRLELGEQPPPRWFFDPPGSSLD